MDILKSKKFQAALVSLVVMIAAKVGYPELDEAMILTFVSPFLTYIAGQAAADVGKERAKVMAGHSA